MQKINFPNHDWKWITRFSMKCTVDVVTQPSLKLISLLLLKSQIHIEKPPLLIFPTRKPNWKMQQLVRKSSVDRRPLEETEAYWFFSIEFNSIKHSFIFHVQYSTSLSIIVESGTPLTGSPLKRLRPAGAGCRRSWSWVTQSHNTTKASAVVKNCEVLQVVAAMWRLQNNRVCDAREGKISLEWTRASFKLSWSRRVSSFRKLSLLKGHAGETWAWKIILKPLFKSYATNILWVCAFVSRHVISIPSAAGSDDTGWWFAGCSWRWSQIIIVRTI